MAGKAPIPHPREWRVVRLGDIVLKIGSGATPAGGSECYLPLRSKFALVRSQNVFDRRFDTSGLAFISEEQAEKLKGVNLQAGDLLLNITGDGITFSRACAVPEEILPACVNQHVAIIRVNSKVANPGYVLSFLTHPKVKSYIESFNAGGSRRAITKGHIESFQLPLPSLAEQGAIARILDALDDKIELNRRMNETLEAMARAVFKSWFVDFDLVRSKAHNRGLKISKPFTMEFPQNFEESSIGDIPTAWRVRPISDLAEIVGGTTPDTKQSAYWIGGRHYWATPKDLSNLSVPVLLETERKITESGLNQIGSGLLPTGTVLLSSRAPIGYLAVTEIPVAINQGFIAMKPKKGVSNLFLLFWAEWAHDEIVSRANGSTFLEISKSSFRPIPVIDPGEQIFANFDKLVRPIYSKLVANECQSRTLASIRDTLLPKLISGELRVKDAERLVEAHV
jgi:type I restriction enzyme S subunit